MSVVYITGFCLTLFGVIYAVVEYKRPIYPTYLAVVIGVGVTLVGQIVMALLLLDLGYGQASVVTGIVGPFALTGLPMAFLQEVKEGRFKDEGNDRRGNTGKLGAWEDGDTS